MKRGRMIKKISAEQLFDLIHTQGQCVEIEWHALENGEVKTANKARKLRHRINHYLFGKEKAQPQYLCQFKHTISLRTELMELMEKWDRRGNEELVEYSRKMLDQLGEELIRLIQEIRKEELEIVTD